MRKTIHRTRVTRILVCPGLSWFYHCQRTAWTRPLLLQRPRRRGREAASCGLSSALLLLTQPSQFPGHAWGTLDVPHLCHHRLKILCLLQVVLATRTSCSLVPPRIFPILEARQGSPGAGYRIAWSVQGNPWGPWEGLVQSRTGISTGMCRINV